MRRGDVLQKKTKHVNMKFLKTYLLVLAGLCLLKHKSNVLCEEYCRLFLVLSTVHVIDQVECNQRLALG